MSNDFNKNLQVADKLIRNPAIIPAILKNYFKLTVLKKKVLRNLQLAVTYDCQYNCFLCATRHLKKERKALNIEQIKMVAREARALGCLNINLTGGEPLLHKELDRIVKAISETGLMVGLITNGGLIEDNLLKRLKAFGLRELAISIHGDEAYHDNFTGVQGSHKKAVRAIEAAKNRSISVVINTVITHDNLNNQRLKDIQGLAHFYNIFIQPILICFPKGDLIDARLSLTSEDFGKFHLLLKAPSFKPLHRNYFGSACPAGNEYIYVGSYGDVAMCDLVQDFFGNVTEEPLITIWQRMLAEREVIGCGHMCIGLKNNADRHSGE